jgi:hypothetical protein
MTQKMMTTPRTASYDQQDAVNNVMLWASLGAEACPTCSVAAAAHWHISDADRDAWWEFIFKVRLWLEDLDSDIVARYNEARARGEDGMAELDKMQNPTMLKTRKADGETQRAIADMLSWSLASAQTECCGNSLGPDESAAHAIGLLRVWLGITHEQLEAMAQRWTFELDDPAKKFRVKLGEGGIWS